MQNHHIRKRIRKWPALKILAAIGIFLLLAAVSYMAADAIDQQARPTSSQL